MYDKSIISSSWLYYKQDFVVKPMKFPATKEEVLENFKKTSGGKLPDDKVSDKLAGLISQISFKAYEEGLKESKQLNMEDVMDNKRCNALYVFKNASFGQLRTIEENGKILFCASDIAKALGYTNPRKAVGDHCRGVTKRYAPTTSGEQEMSFIPEGDVYRLITHSKLPSAEKFESWVFDEVLPKIRQTGSYSMTQPEQPVQSDSTLMTAVVKALEQNTNALQMLIQQQQMMMQSMNQSIQSVNSGKRRIEPYHTNQGIRGAGNSTRISIPMSKSERDYIAREARKRGMSQGEYIYNLSVAANDGRIELD